MKALAEFNNVLKHFEGGKVDEKIFLNKEKKEQWKKCITKRAYCNKNMGKNKECEDDLIKLKNEQKNNQDSSIYDLLGLL